MRHLYRGGLFALLVAMTGALTTGPATADTAEAFQGTAGAQALHLSVLGKDATFGVANVDGASTLRVVANAAGQLLAQASSSSASVNKDNASVSDPTSGLRCGAGQLPAPLDTLLSLNLVCSSVKADIANGAPHAFGQGSVATIALNANTVLKQLNDTLHVGQTLSDTLQPVVKAVNDATNGSLAIDPGSTIQQVIDGLLTTQTLAVKLGVSNSELTTVAGTVTSAAQSQGAQIDILPVAALGNTPLASITVGSAQTKAVYDRVKGAATASADPSLVTVHLAPILGLAEQTIKVAPGETLTILRGTPLESTIIVADGHTETNATSAKAVADGVSLQLLKGLNVGTGTATTAAAPEGGIVLQLAHSESSVSGSPAVVSPVPAAPAPPAAQVKALALTGASPWLGLVGIALLGSAYGARRLTRRFN